MSKHLRAEITENIPVKKEHNLLILRSSEGLENPVPGQFYMIGFDDSYDPFLKRPFSIFRKKQEELHFLYRIKGRGTEKLSKMKKGYTLSLIGPLGNGYPFPDKDFSPILIAGGIGIASIFPLAEKLSGNAYLFYGARNKDELLMIDELKDMSKELIISTDDGSVGEKGTVVDALNGFLASHLSAVSYKLIYACGPSAMLKAVSEIALGKGIKGYLSLEENMACGVGACLGCAVKVRSQSPRRLNSELTYKRVCKEGPVFSIEEIVW